MVRYWIKGRFTRSALIGILVGEAFSIFFILFAGSTFLSFSSRFGLGSELSEITLSLILGFYLIGLIQSGFNGSGLPVSFADVDYVFTSPAKTRDVFAAKVLTNSLTTVLLAFPPIFVLYLRLSSFYGTPALTAALGGFVTLIYFLLGLFLSADVTLSLGSSIGRRLLPLRNAFIVLVLAISLIPLGLLIPGVPPTLRNVIRVLPNGLAAEASVGLVSGSLDNLTYLLDLMLLLAWLGAFSLIGIRVSRRHFYELLQVGDSVVEKELVRSNGISQLNLKGKSVWSVVRLKERILISRTREGRTLLINALFLSVFLIIYSLSGSFQSSPTSFLFILFIIGSFGAGNAMRWIEKERLWILKTSPLSMRRYVKEVFRARLVPLLLYLAPVILVVGAGLILSQLNRPSSLPSIILALPAALQIAAITMGGGMYFASKYGQSTSDDILSSQTQELTDIRRFLYQTSINLILVSPLMALVLSIGWLVTLLGHGSLTIPTILLLVVSITYTYVILNTLLNRAGDSISRREDL